jgi:peptidoglycan/xylan/chitin deacetylase (PgdA/CDA1 family)
MNAPPDNRAVSALFRVFGGAEPPVIADAEQLASCRGMHAAEATALAVCVPLTVWVAIADLLSQRLGNVSAALLGLPLTFLTLQLLPFVFAVKSPAMQWRLWLLVLVAWAIWRRDGDGVVAVFSYAWLGLAVMNLAATAVLAWQASMRWPGNWGVSWRLILFVGLHLLAVWVGWKCGVGWGLLLGAGIAMACCWAVLNPYSQVLGPVHCQADEGEILITLDDGPDPRDTPMVLDLLDRYQSKAVFFMIGEKARAHPELVREVVQRGHEIGNHTLTHPAASFWCAGPWRTRREIAGCQQVIEEITGVKPRWFRAPVGHRNLFTHPIARELGLQVMGWNRRGFDAVNADPERVLARISPKLTGGDIVLLHEATPVVGEVIKGVLKQRAVRLENV